LTQKIFVPLKWKNSGSAGIRIKSVIMKKSLRLKITLAGIRTEEGRKHVMLLRIKRNGNLEISQFNLKEKPPEGLISFTKQIIKDGEKSFWLTIDRNTRHLLEFKNRKGKIEGFYQTVNKKRNIELQPVFSADNIRRDNKIK
jgi:hypothetical protein